jgi:hypothetical protein
VALLLPVPIGTQDLTGRLSSYAAIQGPTIAADSSRPVTYRLAGLDPRVITGTIMRDDGAPVVPVPVLHSFPAIDRRLKGDSLRPPRPADVVVPSPSDRAREAHAALATDAPAVDGIWPDLHPAELSKSNSPAMDTARLYFGPGSMNAPPGVLDPPDPVTDGPPVPAPRPPDAKAAEKGGGGETVAGKGEVIGVGRHPASPAKRLGLRATARAKAEKCLSEAIYFEARSEQLRGQIAVAQVVMNRVFSPFYPNDVCGVVYQNSHRRLACQFTFACDGIPERVTDWHSWKRAKRIAQRTLAGKIWVREVAKSTHYHAAYVRPIWVREMKKMVRYGVHTFYRPRRWGDGSQETTWSNIVHIAARTAMVE